MPLVFHSKPKTTDVTSYSVETFILFRLYLFFLFFFFMFGISVALQSKKKAKQRTGSVKKRGLRPFISRLSSDEFLDSYCCPYYVWLCSQSSSSSNSTSTHSFTHLCIALNSFTQTTVVSLLSFPPCVLLNLFFFLLLLPSHPSHSRPPIHTFTHPSLILLFFPLSIIFRPPSSPLTQEVVLPPTATHPRG